MKKYKLSILAVHSLGIVGFVLMSPVLPDVRGHVISKWGHVISN